jgi:molybdopterin-binding protein
VRVTVEATPGLVAEVTASGMAALGLGEGEEVWASVKATEVSAYPA